LLPNLRAIIPNDVAVDRKRERDRDSKRRTRTAAGMQSRDDYLAQGAQKRDQAHALRRQGLSVRAIAQEMGISVGAVSGYLKNPSKDEPCSKSVGLV